MSEYEERKQARIDYYREKGTKARAESDSLSKQSSDMASCIPMGQPVHGAADRRLRDRIARKMDQSLAVQKKAEYYERKARPSGPLKWPLSVSRIIVGRNDAGKLLVCHCSSGRNNVVVSEFSATGFTVVGRPRFFS